MNTLSKAGIGVLLGTIVAVLPMNINGAQAQSLEPSSTTANYGDWVLRCREALPVDGKADEVKNSVCEMVTIIRIQTPASQDANGKAIPAQSQVLAQVAVGRLPDSKDIKAVFQVPSGIWLRNPLLLSLAQDENSFETAEKLEASYFRCVGGFCLADIDLDATVLASLQAAKVAQVSFTDGARRTINVPISMNGFVGALAALSAK
jgi:invasion protein IalB